MLVPTIEPFRLSYFPYFPVLFPMKLAAVGAKPGGGVRGAVQTGRCPAAVTAPWSKYGDMIPSLSRVLICCNRSRVDAFRKKGLLRFLVSEMQRQLQCVENFGFHLGIRLLRNRDSHGRAGRDGIQIRYDFLHEG